LIAPPEVQELISEALNDVRVGNPNNPSSGSILPQYVSSTYDLATRTFTATFTMTNTLDVDISINDLSADVRCHSHSFQLGHAAIGNPVQLDPGETATFSVVFTWTQTAEEHFHVEHSGQTSINVDLVNLSVDVSGLSIETPVSYNIDIPIPS
jgi:LEA14-like dessication related protein